MKKNRNGFTLAELLIVVAIIAVLVAISIPIFISQLEKSREATDQSSVSYRNGTYYLDVDLKQKKADWQTANVNIAGVTSTDTSRWIGTPQPDGQCRVSYDSANGVKFIWSGTASLTNLTTEVNSNSKYSAESLVGYGNAAYFTKNVKVNGTDVYVRSFYAGEGSTFQKAAEAFEKNPVAEKFTDSSFYKIEKENDKYTSDVRAFAYFDLDENNNIKNYTLVMPDAVYFSPDGGKTWKLK
ncbi:type IV pilin protein [Lactimicrobium massiliense]|uniref:type IV pilin protein n=1 Tax=Lactimicrobium massiliense TaxID=2161814 RepID=UPI000D56171B|nr:prepilin-type N-terminal cleavage/methylation domain-containing protein [Lactimicrobium massiliense]